MHRRYLLLWFGALILLLFALGNPSIQRTQEARVMESARESIGGGFVGWMVPHCNGQVRLRKPPLAYWLSATAFEIGGVNAFAGRLPMALLGWLTVGLTFAIARRLSGDATAGTLCAAILLGSFLFFKHARLAETDILITLFITAAVEAMWRGFDDISSSRKWFLLSGAMIGLTIIGKGPPAAFPMLFLIGCAIVEKRFDFIWKWLTSGALVAMIIVGAPWWLYVMSQPTFRQIMKEETTDVFEGRDHFHWFGVYFMILLTAGAPWSGLGIPALISSMKRWKISLLDRRLLMWITSILLPLCCIGNKQNHYVLPLMPPLAIATGLWLWRATQSDGRERAVAKIIFIATLIVTSLAPIALPIAGVASRQVHNPQDFVVAALLLIGVAVCWWTLRRSDLRRAVLTFAIVCAICISPIIGWWAPSLKEFSPRTIASRIQTVVQDDASYVFYGDNFSLPLIFEMRRIIPIAATADDLNRQRERSHAPLIVIAQTKSDHEPPPLPEGFRQIDSFVNDDQKFELYRGEPSADQSQAPGLNEGK